MSAHKASFSVRKESATVIHIIVASTADGLKEMLGQEVAKVIRAGHAVKHPDGSREWISAGEDYDPETHRMIFHKDGNRCRWTRTHVRIAADGARTETHLRPTWRLPEDC